MGSCLSSAVSVLVLGPGTERGRKKDDTVHGPVENYSGCRSWRCGCSSYTDGCVVVKSSVSGGRSTQDFDKR